MLLTRADISGDWHENACLDIIRVARKLEDVEGYYDKLGVDFDATEEEVRAAGKKLVMETHPDHGGDPDEFMDAVEAYRTLSDPAKRAEYDHMTFIPKASVRTRQDAPRWDFQRDGEPAWYKEPTLLLTEEEVLRVRRWHEMVLEAARGSRLPLEIKVGVCRYPTGYYMEGDIAVIGRNQEPERRMARLTVLMRMCERN